MARDSTGRFTAGNPGRPPGTGKAAKLLLAIGDDDLQSIIRALMQQALDGNTQAAALLLARCIPPLKAICDPIRLSFPPDAGLSDKAHAIMDAVAAGELAPDVAAQLVAALGKVAHIAEVDDLIRRVEALENGHATD